MELEPYLSPARWKTYSDEARRTAVSAEDLYRWNSWMAGALLEVIGHTECAVRQAIDMRLRKWNSAQESRFFVGGVPSSPAWALPDRAASPLRSLVAHRVKEASKRVRRPGGPSHDDVLAQSTFGIWGTLIPRSAERARNKAQWMLWRQALSAAFPGCPAQAPHLVADPLARLLTVRNRIAHSENLLAVDAEERLADCLRVLAAIDQRLADTVAGESRVRSVVRMDPRLRPLGTMADGPLKLRWLDPEGDMLRLQIACRDNVAVDRPTVTVQEVVSTPELARYCELDPDHGDFGLIGTLEGVDAAVAWVRKWKSPVVGYGYIDEQCPEMSLSILEGWRGRGLGGQMIEGVVMEATRRGEAGLSLSVSEANITARRLYRRHGFTEGTQAGTGVMRLELHR